jgi:hypothetical protein
MSGALDTFIKHVFSDTSLPKQVWVGDNLLFAKATRAVAHRDCAVAREVINSSRFPTMFDNSRAGIANLWVTCTVLGCLLECVLEVGCS